MQRSFICSRPLKLNLDLWIFFQNLRCVVQKCLLKADGLKRTSVAFPVIGTGALGFPPHEASRIMLDETVQFCQKQKQSTLKDIRIVLYNQDQSLITTFLREATKIQTQSTKTVKIGRTDTVEVVQGNLINETTDGIVNIIGADMNMNTAGQLSQAIAKACGSQVQNECNQIGKQTPGSVVITTGGNLTARHIIHLVPSSGSKLDLQQCLEAGLRQADAKKLQSVSIPAIGTGGFGLSAQDSAKLTFQAFQNVLETLTSICKVRVVIYQDQMVQTFKQEQQNSFLFPHKVIAPQPVSRGHTTVEVINGNLTKEKTDAVVNIIGTDMNMNTAGQLSQAIAKACGPQVQNECNQIGKQTPGSVVITTGGNLTARHIIHLVPSSGSKLDLQQCLEAGLRQADAKKLQSVSIPAIGTGGFGLSAQDSAKLTFQAFQNVLETLTSICKVRVVIYQDQMVQTFKQEQQNGLLLPHKAVAPQPVSRSHTSVEVINGDLTKEKTDAVVNIIGTDMNMNTAGQLSQAIAKACGPQVQNECNQIGKQTPGSVVITTGGNLAARHIIHLVPSSGSKLDLQQCLEAGLRQADAKKLQSVSIPAIGTGGFGLSAQDSAKLTFQAFQNVLETLTSICKVRVVIYQDQMVQAFKQQQQNGLLFSNKAVTPQPVLRGHISVEVINGDLTKEKTDAVVNIIGTDMNMNTAGQLSKAIAQASGPLVQRECSQKGRQSPGSAIITTGGDLSVPNIIHIIPGSSDKQHLQNCLEEGLFLADKSKLHSISVPAIGTGGYGLSTGDSASIVFQALKSFDRGCVNINKVRIVLFQSNMIQDFKQEQRRQENLGLLPDSSRISRAGKQSSRLIVKVWITSGNETSVTKVKDEIKEVFSKACVTENVNNEGIGSLSKMQISHLESEAHKADMELSVNDRLKCISVRGYSTDVTDMKSKIMDEITKAIKEEKQKQEEENAQMILKLVEWSYTVAVPGKPKVFDRISNAKLEAAHNGNKSTVTLTLEGQEFDINLRTKAGRGRRNGQQITVTRTPKEGNFV